MCCTGTKKRFILLFFAALCLAIGVFLVLFSAIHFSSVYALFTVVVHSCAIFFPALCGGCSISFSSSSADSALWGESGDYAVGAKLSWVLLGMFIILGYAIPIELFRGNLIPEIAVYLCLTGGTVILASIFLFVKLIYFNSQDENAYLFD